MSVSMLRQLESPASPPLPGDLSPVKLSPPSTCRGSQGESPLPTSSVHSSPPGHLRGEKRGSSSGKPGKGATWRICTSCYCLLPHLAHQLLDDRVQHLSTEGILPPDAQRLVETFHSSQEVALQTLEAQMKMSFCLLFVYPFPPPERILWRCKLKGSMVARPGLAGGTLETLHTWCRYCR